jgi:hypothetical protein
MTILVWVCHRHIHNCMTMYLCRSHKPSAYFRYVPGHLPKMDMHSIFTVWCLVKIWESYIFCAIFWMCQQIWGKHIFVAWYYQSCCSHSCCSHPCSSSCTGAVAACGAVSPALAPAAPPATVASTAAVAPATANLVLLLMLLLMLAPLCACTPHWPSGLCASALCCPFFWLWYSTCKNKISTL